MAMLTYGARHHLEVGSRHDLPVQEHRHTRGHQVHVDISEHTDPNVTIRYHSEVSTDGGETWSYGGGFTVIGERRTATSPTYSYAVFGHEPHPRMRLPNGKWVGADPAAHRLVRGSVHLERTDPKLWESAIHPGVASVFTQRPLPSGLTTSVHVSGTQTADLDHESAPT
jgi:hypothetical protein